ncbi:type IV pilus biogenesis protein PilP [Burkholderia cenocepacia]|uniref:type IV pilus biogenesis protein PilP n=1 Tax=Burkholderia cenocepacia TaxID=95486 RepID=UPI002AB6E2CD|nr:type IV pilus biogenesis protein PilP [Burkholderia cenocepacia]
MKPSATFAVAAVALVVAVHANATPATSSAPGAASAPTDAQISSAIAAAQPLDRPESDGARLASLQKRIPILQAEKQIAELEKAIRDANGSPGAAGIPVGMPPGVTGQLGVDRAPGVHAVDRASGPVQVRGIDSYNGKFSATLAAGSRIDDVHVGDTFEGWRVARISVGDVTLTRSRGGRTETRVVRY